jgi:pullulanase/glycogen debranching enzyme
MDRDGYQEDKIIALITWCQNNEFWARNIESVSKLRKQYERLREQALQEWERKQRGATSITETRARAGLDLANKYAAEEAAEQAALEAQAARAIA